MEPCVPFLLVLLPSLAFGSFIDPDAAGHTYTVRVPAGQPIWDFNMYDNHHQSPVDLDLHNIERIWVDQGTPLTITAVRDQNIKYLVRNSGHGVEVVIDPNEVRAKGEYIKPRLHGGILQDTYIFQNVHYHWGNDDMNGSEHKLNGRSFSLEGHMVTYKQSYGNLQEALKHKDGVVVFTFFAEVEQPNDHLQQFISYLPGCHNYQDAVPLTGTDAFLWFLTDVGLRNTDYYAYPGSLTTPQYSECVTFVIAVNPVPISHEQLQAFRHLISDHGSPVLSNQRALQPFDRRPIAYIKNNLRVDYNYIGQSTYGQIQDNGQFGYSNWLAEHDNDLMSSSYGIEDAYFL